MKKLWIWSGIILGVIVLIIILCFTFFGVNNVKVEFKTSSLHFSEENYQEIAQTAELKKHSCVLFLNKKQPTQKLEQKFPYLKIVNIEVVFPNNIVIHCAEREELFAIKISETSSAICDEQLKILRIENQPIENTQTNPIVLSGISIAENLAEPGQFLSFGTEVDAALKSFAPAFKLNNRQTIDIKALIKTVEVAWLPSVSNLKDLPALILTDFQNYKAKIIDAGKNLSYKINNYLEVITKLTYEDKQNSFLYIYQDKDNKIVAHLVKNPA